MAPPSLLSLAPTDLTSQRPSRFDGTGSEVPLHRFDPVDQALLGRIYKVVQGLPVLSRRTGPKDPALKAYIRRAGDGALMTDAQRLGVATRAAGLEDTALRKAVHDIRGGGLTVLLGTAELMDHVAEDLVPQCVDAARDHAKIMRCLLPEIDPRIRDADETAKPHGIGHFVDKWCGLKFPRGTGFVTVRVRCEYTGSISARCLETSSIDRVLYNYINNAIRFAADGEIDLWVFPVGTDLVRWVVRNSVAPDQKAFLDAAAQDLTRLYAGGVTRGGTGVGLTNCAEIVGACFGMSPEQVVERAYLGSKRHGDDYLAWFHWPKYIP